VPFALPLPKQRATQGWSVKIFDKENREDPHVTILHRGRKWRLNLRTRAFMDAQPPPKDIPDDVMSTIFDDFDEICVQWDLIHKANPVRGAP
jgi:hypothetical protein